MRERISGTGKLANVCMLRAGEEPPLAAHLITVRRGYTHHGLHVGQGRIVHYAGLAGGLRGGTVEEVSLDQFARGHAVGVRIDSPPRFETEDVIRRARSRLGENRYHVLRNNCEHFCEWCLSGVSRSPQVESMLGRAAALMVAMMDATATTARLLLQVSPTLRRLARPLPPTQ